MLRSELWTGLAVEVPTRRTGAPAVAADRGIRQHDPVGLPASPSAADSTTADGNHPPTNRAVTSLFAAAADRRHW